MTGGTVVVLGDTGRNFGAGMTNGVAYVLDETGTFPSRLNDELVQASRLMDADELSAVYELVREHFERTASRRAEAVLDVWDVYRGQFWKIAPRQASIAAEAASSVPGARAAAEPAPTRVARAPA
jgi:glutamate synthase domain-containing protein 3